MPRPLISGKLGDGRRFKARFIKCGKFRRILKITDVGHMSHGMKRSVFVCAAVDVGGARRPLATVFSKVSEQLVHALVVGSINQVAAGSLLCHQSSIDEFLKMKRQSGRWDGQSFLEGARGEAIVARHDQGSKNLEPQGLGKRSQRLNHVFCFHNSRIIEIYREIKQYMHCNKSERRYVAGLTSPSHAYASIKTSWGRSCGLGVSVFESEFLFPEGNG